MAVSINNRNFVALKRNNMIYNKRYYLHLLVIAFCATVLTSCSDDETSSAVETLPMPPEYETNKDKNVKPGDSFFDYCNGTWLANNPIPTDPDINLGGLYACEPVMIQRVEELKKSIPDLGHFYDLVEHMDQTAAQSEAYVEARKAEIVKPTSKEEAFRAIGRMMLDGVEMWPNGNMSTFSLKWNKGQFAAMILPPLPDDPQLSPTFIEDCEVEPLTSTRGAGTTAQQLIAEGMGIDPSMLRVTPELEPYWEALEGKTVDELYQYMLDAWDIFKKTSPADAKVTIGYSLSYHFAQKYLTESMKNKFLGYTKKIQASLRKRIQKVDWMSETTKQNAIEKLDHYGLFVLYPDEWHMDCIPALADCQSALEAVHRNNRGIAHLKAQLLGGTDVFSYYLFQTMTDSSGNPTGCDLTLVNAMYSPNFNCILIYPAILLPPMMPEEGYCEAVYYAGFTTIGHEFTHGFDSNGSKYDLYGEGRNWWTVADKMAFKDRCQYIINCYNNLELDPVREPLVFGDGDRTQTENIADLGGFLTALDAYQELLDSQGFTGEARNDQLRKFYEAYAHVWCVQYGETKWDVLVKSDIHSHARLRINGVVMNTDLWYTLYNVDRNNLLYLPPERRAYIW